MDTMNTLYSRKSIRTYTGEKISDQELNEILKAAQAAPVGMGKYDTVHLTVIESPKILKKIDDNTKATFQNPEIIALYGAPTFIVVSVKPSSAQPNNVEYSNAAIMVHNMALAAVNMGIGCCDIWGAVMALNANNELIGELELPKDFVPCCGIILGKTTNQYSTREIPENRVSINCIK